MIWEDLVLEREVDNSEMASALADAFQIDGRDVSVVDLLPAPADSAGLQILAERRPCRGEFSTRFNVIVLDDEGWRRVEPFDETVRVAQRLCSRLKTSCFIQWQQN